MMRRTVVLVVFAACGGSSSRPATPAPATTTEAMCFDGTTTVLDPQRGQELSTSRGAIRRVLDPAAGTIVEEVHTAEDGGVAHYLVTAKVEGDHFTMTEAAGAFTGSGTLSGTPWRWDRWSSTSTLPEGMEVISSDQLTSDGLAVEGKVSAGGQVVVTTRGQFATIPCAQFAAAVASLATPAASP